MFYNQSTSVAASQMECAHKVVSVQTLGASRHTVLIPIWGVADCLIKSYCLSACWSVFFSFFVFGEKGLFVMAHKLVLARFLKALSIAIIRHAIERQSCIKSNNVAF